MAAPLHKAEVIMTTIEALLVDLATPKDVRRGSTFPLDQLKDLPAVLLYQGAEVDLEEQAHDELLVELEVWIEAYTAQKDDDQVPNESMLNRIEREVIVALANDENGEPKLGLGAFVRYIKQSGRDAPELNQEYDRPAMMQRFLWRVVYTRSRTDPAN